MKNLFLPIICLFTIISFTSNGQLQVRNDAFVQIGYEDYRTLSFGIETNIPNNGRYALEHWNNGLNFWKPWPTSYAANYILFLRDDRNVGIGTSGSSSYRLDVAGSARSWGWYTTSDERLKEKIKPVQNSLSKVLQLNPVEYAYNSQFDKYAGLNTDGLDEIKRKTIEADNDNIGQQDRHIGFLAQEVQKILPSAVKKQEDGFLSMNYNEIVPLLAAAMKEQQKQIEDLRKQVLKLQDASVGKSSNGQK